MGRELPTEVMLGQTLVLMQMTFLNNVRKVGRLVLSRTPCFISARSIQNSEFAKNECLNAVYFGTDYTFPVLFENG
jgi:hypothetical protein